MSYYRTGIDMTFVYSRMEVEHWLRYPEISKEQIEKYPNAAKAAEIKASPLGKALE